LWPPTYDSSGNLFVETKASNYVCEIVYGRSPETLSVDNSGFSRPTISFPGGATWDGTYLAFTDQQYGGRSTAAIYQVQEVVSGGLSVIGTTRLTDNCYANHTDVVQPFIVRKVVVGGNLVCTNQVDYWRYPFGGRPSSSLPSAPQAPYGQSVSIVR
jgi:hypothetical protein